ncbi:MAG: UvrD-helicase domain-containing protein [Gemmatimonadota bacterium]
MTPMTPPAPGDTRPQPEDLPDAEARRAIAENLDDTLFVEAAAGTGKTTALVGRIVEVIRRGRGTLDDMVAVTFTEKAAGEMKLRLRGEIEKARALAMADAPEDAADRATDVANLDRALEQLELAHIGTIHGFCTDLLKERPIEAGVDPAFQVAAEDEAGRLLDDAFERWFQKALADPPPGVRRALRRAYARNVGGPRGALRKAAGNLTEHRDFEASWRRPDFDRESELDRAVELVRELGDFAARAANPDDHLTKHLRNLHRRAHELELREAVHGRDHDYVEALLRSLIRNRRVGWHWTGFKRRDFGQGLDKADVIARRDEIHGELQGIFAQADADVAALLRDELRPVIAVYEELKRREGRLDFVDLLIRTRDLLRDDPLIRRHYQQRFSHLFLDEFQDTDPLQVEIAMLLCADDPDETDPTRIRPSRGKLFVVGDPKQSIYRFRRADVMLYEQTRRRLVESGAIPLRLETSFRSQPRIQAAVNGAFSRRMTGSDDGSQAAYVPLARYRDDVDGQPAVIALPVPRPYGKFGTIYKRAIEDSLPDAVGAFVDWLVNESGWKVTERENAGMLVPVRARHVCLLFRRFQSWGNDVTRPYVRALEAREIPHVLVGGRSYFDREEVLAVRNALTAIEWPDDRLSMYGALRGPLFSLGDGTLLHFTSEIGPLHSLRPFGEHESVEGMRKAGVDVPLMAVAEALEILGALHRHRNRRPLPETILRLLAAVRAHAGIAIWPTGEQALANVLRVVDRARAFERTGAPSFRAFLDRLEDEAERGQAEEAPIVEEGTEGVRMMTVHKAKGLEFPVVVLADMTCNATFETPTRHVDPVRGLWAEALCGAAPLDLLDNIEVERVREVAEADRLTYVAATRARDLLIVPGLGDGRDGEGGFDEDGPEWWLESLNPALYPSKGARRTPRSEPSAQDLGAPEFGPESVVRRQDRNGADRPTPRDSVAPGRHTAKAGNDVVWWDPEALELDVDAPTGERQKRLLDVDEEVQPTLSVEEGIAAHDAWQSDRAAKLLTGATPAISVRPVKAVVAAEVEAAAEAEAEAEAARRRSPGVDWVEVPRPAGEDRPRGNRFGTLVHEALVVVPFDSDEEAVRRFVASRAARLGCPVREATAAAALVGRALAHPVMTEACAASETRREIPLFVRSPDGDLVEGVADLAYRVVDGDGRPEWVVVDYKTDRDPTQYRELYERQVSRYTRMLSAIVGEPARGVVLVL